LVADFASFTAESFKRYGGNERPEHFDRIVQSWDTFKLRLVKTVDRRVKKCLLSAASLRSTPPM
jgi:hypothetical protein